MEIFYVITKKIALLTIEELHSRFMTQGLDKIYEISYEIYR